MNQSSNNISVREDEDISISRIGPWKNRAEFGTVYNWLFSENATRETKQKACDMLNVWKLRRQNLTPASVLSTLAIVEIQLKDDQRINSNSSQSNELRTIYSNAFTRFLNYMSSIMQNKNLKTMYMTAKELGIESFLVDLRHLCAHGQVMPSLDVFRRTATYCLKWLKDFYWNREINSIQDADVNDVRLKSAVEFEESVRGLFTVYDAATEAITRKFKYIEDIAGDCIESSYLESLRACGVLYRTRRLAVIVTNVTNDLTALASRESKVRGNGQLFCDVLFRSRYFIETAATFFNAASTSADTNTSDNSPLKQFISLHQNLFRAIAICGYIEICFNSLITICEDDHETIKRRQGASFWADQIVKGFLIFRDVKNVFKAKKEKNSKFVIDLAPVNTEIMSKNIRDIYKHLGVNCSGVLIFGDTIRRPWALNINRKYLQERIENVNSYTKNTIIECISLVEPALSKDQQKCLKDLIQLYTDNEAVVDAEKNPDDISSAEEIVYSVGEHLLLQRDQQKENLNENGEKQYGIWTEVNDGFNWQTVPIGRLPWD